MLFSALSFTAPFLVMYILSSSDNLKSNVQFKVKYSSLIGGLNLYNEKPSELMRGDKSLKYRETVSVNEGVPSEDEGMTAEEKKLEEQ